MLATNSCSHTSRVAQYSKLDHINSLASQLHVYHYLFSKTALAGNVMLSVVSVCSSVPFFHSYLLNRLRLHFFARVGHGTPKQRFLKKFEHINSSYGVSLARFFRVCVQYLVSLLVEFHHTICVTSHPNQLSLLPSVGRQMSTGQSAAMLCG